MVSKPKSWACRPCGCLAASVLPRLGESGTALCRKCGAPSSRPVCLRRLPLHRDAWGDVSLQLEAVHPDSLAVFVPKRAVFGKGRWWVSFLLCKIDPLREKTKLFRLFLSCPEVRSLTTPLKQLP